MDKPQPVPRPKTSRGQMFFFASVLALAGYLTYVFVKKRPNREFGNSLFMTTWIVILLNAAFLLVSDYLASPRKSYAVVPTASKDVGVTVGVNDVTGIPAPGMAPYGMY